jgi:hypothetical protein
MNLSEQSPIHDGFYRGSYETTYCLRERHVPDDTIPGA